MSSRIPDGKSPTLQDIAAIAGVSPSTVSRVLNNSENVRSVIQNRVIQAASDLGYQKIQKQNSDPSVKNVIGLIIPDIMNPFFPALIKGIQNTSHIQDYNIILCDSEDDKSVAEAQLRQLMMSHIRGLIYIPSSEDSGMNEKLLKLTIPVVFLDRRINSDMINFVGSENTEGAYNAARYLLSLGHREILYLAGSGGLSTEKERFAGFKRALNEDGIEIEEDNILACAYSREIAFEKVKAWLDAEKKATAIFASDDLMAYGALQALKQKNLRCPEDISVLGYDDLPFSDLLSLTTVSQPAYQMGQNAVLLLLDLINKKKPAPQEIILPSSMIIRNTCRKR